MNSFAAINLFENPLVLMAIVVVWVLVSWLKMRRQRSEADQPPASDERLSSPSAEERPERAPDLQDVLRQLMGGEPPPQAPLPPPIPRALRDGEPSDGWSDEEQVESEGHWTGETQEAYEEARPAAHEIAEPSRQHAIALAQTNATRIEAGERQEKDARRFAQLIEQGEHPATVVSTAHGHHSRAGARAVSLWGDPRTVRRAFVASLIFAPPKAFEN